MGQIADGAGQFHACRSASDDDKSHPRTAAVLVDSTFRRLESQEDPAANLGRVLDRLKTRRKRLPLVVAKVVMPCAGGNNQGVVRLFTVAENHAAAFDVDIGRFGQEHANIGLPLENRPQRYGNVRRRESSRRHLVEQRLEQMKVAAIEQSHIDGHSLQPTRAIQSAKPAANDDHSMGHAGSIPVSRAQISSSIRAGSSTISLTCRRNPTASRPSTTR